MTDIHPPSLCFGDQYAFRPTGSPAAALITLLHSITNLLAVNPYVIVISLDFSKAFDTVRHSTLLHKMAQLNIPDEVYNWLANFFQGHSHCTQYRGVVSTVLGITASIVQGSAIGPASYVVGAADLRAVVPGNELVKFADDTYIVIPAANDTSRQAELNNVEEWALENNLKVNSAKFAEIVFVDSRKKKTAQPPPPLPGIVRVTVLKILGVTFTNSLSVAEHIHAVISSCAQTLYALRVLRAHGMDDVSLQTIYRSVIIAKLMHASSAWWGFASASDRQRIAAFIRRSDRSRFVPVSLPTFTDMCQDADEKLFGAITSDGHHVLNHLLPPQSQGSQNYNLRRRIHNYALPTRTGHLTDKNFIQRMLYSNAY